MESRLVVLLLVLLLAVGANAGFAASDSLTLRYYGQSFFLITTAGGTRIVLDPFGNIGFPMPSGVEADAVFITHEHGDHNNGGLIGGNPKVFRGLTANPPGWNIIRERIGDALVYSVPSFHDNEGGTSGRGFNALLVVEANGLRIAHLGDLGQAALTDTQVRALGRVDILLIPVGGAPFTIGGAEATRITEQLAPRIVIPMHYKTEARPQWPGADEQAFLAGKSNVRRSGTTLTFSVPALPAATQITVMNYR
jgi:L-ascorbate metabolism protein UlaG (beta-lactamase superfamily)